MLVRLTVRPAGQNVQDHKATESDSSGSRANREDAAASKEGQHTMPDTGPEAGANAAVEGLKGSAKEVVGDLSGKENLQQEGQAQQDKARAEREVAEQEAKAEASRAQAETLEAEQQSHQD